MKIVNRMIVGLGLGAALAGAAVAAASDGPFNTVQDVVDYWAVQPGSVATQIYVDGFKVYERGGFGPAYVLEYFGCGKTGGIRTHCTNDPFAGFINTTEPIAQFGAGKTIYLDGKLVQSGSPYYGLYLKTCHGEQSFYGKVRYYVIQAETGGFSPPFPGNDCFQ